MKKIYYLAHYDFPAFEQKRNRALAGCTKIEYVCGAIASLGYQVELISASNTIDKPLKPTVRETSDNICVRFLRGFKRGSKLRNKISTACYYTNLLFHLLKNIKSDDTLVAYHSLILIRILSIVKKIKKCRLILEVEEIYGDVIGDPKIVNRELEFFKCADAYIFPTKLLDEKINDQCKPSAIAHGTYRVEPDRGERFDDNLIHVVYAGTFDPRKGGVAAAVAAAEYLSSEYHLHILGRGSDANTQLVKDKIAEVSQKTEAKITYDGLLSGEEYIRFIQKCHIGLSTQNPNADFNATSFPSKILSYMANGLQVVSIKIPVVETSAVAEYILFYEKQTPNNIATTIKKAFTTIDVREKVEDLNRLFALDLQNLLEERTYERIQN